MTTIRLPLRYLIALLATISFSILHAQTDAFTYQGRLERNGAAFTGTALMQLKVMDAATAGATLSSTFGAYQVVNGEFTVSFTSVPASVFNGSPRWMEIGVDDPDVAGLTYVPLTPRQPITAAPYAMRANLAASATTITGTVAATQITGSLPASQISGNLPASQISGNLPASQISGSLPASQISGNLPTSQLSGTISPSTLSTGTTNSTLTFNPASGAPFAVLSTTKVANLNADLLDGLDSSVFLQKGGGTLTGNLSVANPAALDFGSTTRQMLNLFGTSFGMGVQVGTLYQRSNSDFSWFRGGVHSDSANTPGAGGVETMRLNSTGVLSLFGTQASVLLQNRNDATKVWQAYSDGAGAADAFHIWSATSGDLINLTPDGSLGVTGRVTTPHLLAVSANQVVAAVEAAHNIAGGNAVDARNLATTGVGNGVYAQCQSAGGAAVLGVGATGGWGGKFIANGTAGWAVNGVSDTGYAGYFDGKFYCSKDGYFGGGLCTTVLTICGGADVAEPFPMTKTDETTELEPGSVVVIDEAHPGKLKLSTEACDTRVAGIVSGAGGVKPGLRLHQEGVMEGDQHVALSGRVYVKADTTNGAIKPGDLLTTSDTPGHAAKVTDHARAQGAVLGKAMSSLNESDGLVLVLVTLQ